MDDTGKNETEADLKMNDSPKDQRVPNIQTGESVPIFSQCDASRTDAAPYIFDHEKGTFRCRNRRETGRAVRLWLQQYYSMQSAASFWNMMPYYMMSMMPPSQFTREIPSPSTGVRFSHPQQQHPHHHRPGIDTQTVADGRQGREYHIPKLWRRIAAEIIDFMVLLYVKIIVTVIVMKHMGLIEIERYELDYRVLFSLDDIDLERAFAYTSEVIALEIVNRICVTVIETLCLRQGIHEVGGATPGKRLLGLRVVSYEKAIDLPNGKVKIIPAENIGLISALVRSIIKNFMIAFFFPGFLTVILFKNKRTCYDVLAKTVVVKVPGRNII